MKSLICFRCKQLAPGNEEKTILYEDTLEMHESVTSAEYLETHKNITDGILSAAIDDRLPYNYCIERCGKEHKGTVYMTRDFATKLAGLAYGLSEWLLEYYNATVCFTCFSFDDCDAMTDEQVLPLANSVLNKEEGVLYDATWKRYIETAAKDFVQTEGLSDDKCAAVRRCVEDKLYVIVYRTATLLKNHTEKLSPTFRIEVDMYNFSKIIFSEMLAAGIPAVCGA